MPTSDEIRSWPSPQRTLGSFGERGAPGRSDASFGIGAARRLWAAPLIALAACHPPTAGQPDAARTNAKSAANAQAADARIPCATGGAATLTRTCTVDRETSPRGLVLTLHHADGGFHRLLVTRDGHGVIAADGAQGASVAIVGPDEIEVRIGGDRYRLPATIGKPKA